jgi:hypothetical protein
VGILSMWREARGSVLRQQLDDLLARMRNANDHARFAFLTYINQTVDEVVAFYTRASPAERKKFMKAARKDMVRALLTSGGIRCLGAHQACFGLFG